jgi:hypothetical protein
MILDVVLIVLLIVVLGGGVAGWRGGIVGPDSPVAWVLAVVIILLVLGLILPHIWPYPTVVAPVR